MILLVFQSTYAPLFYKSAQVSLHKISTTREAQPKKETNKQTQQQLRISSRFKSSMPHKKRLGDEFGKSQHYSRSTVNVAGFYPDHVFTMPACGAQKTNV